jgi:transposase
MSRKQISLDIRNLVIRDRQRGDSFRIIANKYSISVGAVQHIWKKYKTHGIVTNYSGKGRKRATTFRDDTRIVRMVKQNPKLSSRNIVESMNLNVSSRTVRRRLRESGLKSVFASKRPFINKINKKKRFTFAKKYANMPLGFWKKVL